MAALKVQPDRIRTLVSMAIVSSHRLIIGKSCDHPSASFLDLIFIILAGNEYVHYIRNDFKI